jgi:hypothetical protein
MKNAIAAGKAFICTDRNTVIHDSPDATDWRQRRRLTSLHFAKQAESLSQQQPNDNL